MKKTALLSLAGLVSVLFVQTVSAANGTVTFTGEIVKSACDVVSADKNKTVALGKYPTSAFPTTGSTSGAKAFSIGLEKCEAGDYTLRFDGNTPAGFPNLLAIASGGATGVGVEILDNNGATIPVTQDISLPDVQGLVTVAASGTATFNLRARYKSFQSQVTAGAANSSATFTIQYK